MESIITAHNERISIDLRLARKFTSLLKAPLYMIKKLTQSFLKITNDGIFGETDKDGNKTGDSLVKTIKEGVGSSVLGSQSTPNAQTTSQPSNQNSSRSSSGLKNDLGKSSNLAKPSIQQQLLQQREVHQQREAQQKIQQQAAIANQNRGRV